MKNKYFILSVLVLVAGSVISGYNINSEKRTEKVNKTYQIMKNTKTGFEKDWKNFKVDANLKIKANEKSIAEFKVKIKKEDKTLKAKYKKEVAVLEQKNVELKNKLRKYKYEGEEKWEEFKAGFNHDMDVVGNSIRDFFTTKD
jgi:flagellar hook protein FlgE